MKLMPMDYQYLRYSTTKFLDKIANSVYDTVDLYLSGPQLNVFDYSLSQLLQLNRDLKKRQITVGAMTPENCVYPVNFCTQDRTTRESSLRYYQRTIDTAEFLECPRVQISTGFGYFDQSPDEAWRLCRDSLKQLSEYAEKKHVVLMLEELKDTTTNVLITSKDIARMLSEVGSSHLVGMVDTDQMTFAGETISDYMKNLGPNLQYVHFNDRGHTVPGDADFPMKRYYQELRDGGYTGPLSFEICDRRYFKDPDASMDQITDWLRANTDELVGA